MNVNSRDLNPFEELWIASFNGRGAVPISSLVDQLISDISRKVLVNQAPLENLTNLYHLTLEQIEESRFTTDQTLITSAVIGMLEGLVLIISPLSETVTSTNKAGGFIHEVNKINEIMKENLEDAKKAFQQLALKVLAQEIKIESFVELSIVSPKYDEKLCNWITPLCMLEKEIRNKR